MAVESGKSNLIHDTFNPASVAPKPQIARGRPIVATVSLANGVGANTGSRYELIDLPSDCILASGTDIKADAWGFATLQIGTFEDPDALLSAARVASHKPVTVNGANHGLSLWQVLGLAKDPGGMIRLYVYGPADATGAGTLKAEIHYRHH